MAFTEELADAMVRAKMRVEEVAVEMTKAGVETKADTVTSWLSGRREPRARQLVALAYVLGTKADELMPIGAGS